MRVAVSGIRGVPANFGGSETAAEEIGKRLARDGVDVVVYCRSHNSATDDRTYKGMRRLTLPSIKTFQLDTISHSALAALHMRFRNTADIIHFHGLGNGLVLPLLWGSGKRTVVTIDGPDWTRPKWGRFARVVLRIGASWCVKWADEIIIDNHPSIAFFQKRYGVTGTYIPYGADRGRPQRTGYLDELGLVPRRYVLFVGALVPDKGADLLVEAYRRVRTELPLVVVGDSPFAASYGAQVRELAARDGRVMMLGYVRGHSYRELVYHAGIYVHPLRSDGTSPALLQALGSGNCVVVNSIPETLSAVGDAAVSFRRNDPLDLTAQLQMLLDDPSLIEQYRQRAVERAAEEYDWDKVTAAHCDVYQRCVARHRGTPARRSSVTSRRSR
ncbi:MAG: glycosyltransferase family 1 protein [Actinobacteria bacterium]|nr:MAG: glycosyltransferase family 1 protein [Actinomycetota bacterium]